MWEPDHKTYIEDALIREAKAVDIIDPNPWVDARDIWNDQNPPGGTD